MVSRALTPPGPGRYLHQDVLRPSALPLGVFAPRRREPDRRPHPARRGIRAAGGGDHRPRESARRLGLSAAGEEDARQADPRHGGIRRPRRPPGAKPYYHLVLLARDQVGYRNLVKLSSLAYTEGFYSKPRVDRELLARFSEGIIVSSACLAGEV